MAKPLVQDRDLRRRIDGAYSQLREQLASLSPEVSEAPEDEGSVRARARTVASKAALEMDSLWRDRPGAEDGPIDVIDMFSGCGGMSAGFAAVNSLLPAYRLAMAVDIASEANETYAANLGLKPLNADIGALAEDPKELDRVVAASRRRPGHPLVLIGCAPCQGFSSHRNAAGAGDGRNNLFVMFAKIAARLQPDAVVVENVPELLTNQYWEYLQTAREILGRKGYSVHVGIHNMAEFGVPQERFRTLLLAMKTPFTPLHPFLARERFRTVKQAIGSLRPIAAGERDPSDPMHYTAGHRDTTIATIRSVPKDGGNRSGDAGPDCLRRAEAKSGRAAYEDVYGRLFWNRPAITVTAYARNPASGRYVHPEQDRGLSVREAALLQSFPSNYTFEGTLDERFRQIGNAVPPAFAAFLGVHVLGELLAPPAKKAAGIGVAKPVGPSFARLIPALKAGHRDLAGLSLPLR